MFTAIGIEESSKRQRNERRRDQLGYRKRQGHKEGWAGAKESRHEGREINTRTFKCPIFG